ncbi:ATP-binding protein [Pseudonocardia hispaniensis]|uniref:ATP-binding protein n=1 Tax=Pseudonocardia hispaniensis TaxID=904933 RepID=A0ABW1J4D0_9PSEU
MPVEIRLLGSFAVTLHGRPVPESAWPPRRAADLVQLLALAPGRSLLRDQVLDALWPDLPAEAGAASLHRAAHWARRVLGPDAVALRGGRVTLFPGDEVSTDVDRFEAAARRARSAQDATLHAAAADLYGGELLPERRYADWTTFRREALRLLHRDMLRGARRWDELVELDPCDEAAQRALMRRHLARGDRHAALRQFGLLRAALARELGVAPGTETLTLVGRITGSLARARRDDVLIGREVELARLRAALRAGMRVMLVTGEPGIGKTRLCEQLVAAVAADGALVLPTAGLGAEDLPFAAVLRAADSALAARPELAEALPADARSAFATPLRDRSPFPTRAQLIAALDRLCGAGAPALLFLDDAHLADEESLGLLVAFARCTRARVTVLLSLVSDPARPAAQRARAELLGRPGSIEVTLGPLTREETRELVEHRCGRRVDPETVHEVWAVSGGHPLVTVEVAAGLIERGRVEVPASAAAVVGSRLDRLPAELTEALRRVAVVEEALDVAEFAALAGLDPDATPDLLERAMDAGLIEVAAGCYRFRTAVIRRVLTDGLPPHRRAAVHRQAADRLATANAPAARVARHLLAAGQEGEALPWLVRAADRAAGRGAYAEALAHVETGLKIEPDRLDLLSMRAEFGYASGDPAAPVAFGVAAAAASGETADALRIRQARVLLMAGDAAGTAQALDGIVPTERTRLAHLLTTGLLAWFTGRIDEAEQAAGRAGLLATLAGRPADVLDATMLRALVAHSRGRYGAQLVADVLDPRNAAALAGMLSDTHLCMAEIVLDDPDGRAELAEFASRIRDAAGGGAARGVAFATTVLGEAQFLDGDLAAAEANLLAGARAHRVLGERGGEAVALHRLAELAIAVGRPAAAGPLLDDALDAARCSPLSTRHLLTRIYGTMASAAADDDAALAVLDSAELSLVRPAEVCPLCRVPFLVPAAAVRARTGDVDAAERLLAAAEPVVEVLWRGRGRWPVAIAEVRALLDERRPAFRARAARP